MANPPPIPILRYRLVFVWLFATVFLSACAPQPEPEQGGIAFGLAQNALTLDPRYATDAASVRINRLLYSRLVEFDQNRKPVAGIAEWRMISPVHYRFRLLDGRRRFSDGSRLTADDVAFTYRSVLDPKSASPHRHSLRVIRKIEAVGEEQVDFYLFRPDVLFPGRLILGIMPEPSGAKQAIVGAGAFAFLDRPASDRLRIMRRQDGFLVDFVQVADASVRVLKLLAGELDLIQNDLPPELIRYLAKRKEVASAFYPSDNYAYLGFNLRDPVSADRRIRQAVAHGIDREKIVRYLFDGRAELAEGLLAKDHWAANPTLKPYPHDPVKARKLLRDAGFSERRPLRLSYKISTDAQRVRIATIIQQQLAKVGIRTRIRSYEWGSFYGDIKAGRFQMFSLAWVGVKMPDIFRYLFHSGAIPPEGANRGGLQDSEIDRLIEAAEQEIDLERKAMWFRELQSRVHRILPYVPLWREDHVVVHRTELVGYRTGPDGNYDALEQVYLTE